ncbi:hypothetical protein H2198_002744 [Neophaeococcomyces mojaviensis]|uniref:Uncharacterized protein n=1 Tax=Neophaeococcomyces mojaviensis TaxID=3383035 RepID=A0ACC3ADS0_9EURO|nr:hypothetical protein H2198_002744 [Knufia sp. JES_112]
MHEHCREYVRELMPKTNALASSVETCLDEVSTLCQAAFREYTGFLQTKDKQSLDRLKTTTSVVNQKLAGPDAQAHDSFMGFSRLDAQQQSDTAALERLFQRWKKSVPTHEFLDEEERNMVQAAQRAITNAFDAARNAETRTKAEQDRRSLAEATLNVISVWNPFAHIGRQLVNPVGDIVSTSPAELRRRAEALDKEIELQLQTLTLAITNLVDSLKPAVKAVQAIYICLSLLETEFKKIKDLLEDLPQGSDVNEHSILHDTKEWQQLNKFGSENPGVNLLRVIAASYTQAPYFLPLSTVYAEKKQVVVTEIKTKRASN